MEYIYEPDFGPAQWCPKLLVHYDGSFRAVYTSYLETTPYSYSRFFFPDGTPAGNDTLVSLDINLSPVSSSIANIGKTNTDDALVLWGSGGDIFGTTFTEYEWSGVVNSYNVSPSSISGAPRFDINNNNYVSMIWRHSYDPPYTYISNINFQTFSNLFNPASTSQLITGPWEDYHPIISSIALRDDGRFIIGYCQYIGWNWAWLITIQTGVNYETIVGNPISFSPYGKGPYIDKSPTGYWMSWIAGEYEYVVNDSSHIYLQELDSDGVPVSEPYQIDEEEAIPSFGPYYYSAGLADLAVSDSSGNFAICWQDERFDEGDIFCRQFNPDGSFYGREYRVNSDPVGPLQKEPAVTFGPEDRLYFTWTDFRNPGGQGDIYCKVIEWIDATAVEPEPEPNPYIFALHKPYPNPFNASTTISFTLPVQSEVRLDVFDISGRNVTSHQPPAASSQYPPGTHHIQFDASGLSSGVYIVRLEAGEHKANQKIVLMK